MNRGASAKALAITLAAAGTWSAPTGEMRGSVIHTGYSPAQFLRAGRSGKHC